MENHRWFTIPEGHTLPETHFKQTDALLDSYLALCTKTMSALICVLMYICCGFLRYLRINSAQLFSVPQRDVICESY